MGRVRMAEYEFDPERIEELRCLYARLAKNKADVTGLPLADITGRRRWKALVPVRSEIWLEMWSLGYSTPEIGHVVGRDHSTIVRSNVILRHANSDAGYAIRARAAEARRMSIMSARAGKAAEAARRALETAQEASRTLMATRDAALQARIAYAKVQRSLQDVVVAQSDAEAEAVKAKAQASDRMGEMATALMGLRGRARYDAVVEAMQSLDRENAETLWAEYCKSQFPHSADANIANPPRAWVVQMKEAA